MWWYAETCAGIENRIRNVIRKAMQYLEAKPEECIAIEDSFIGIQAAKAANIEVVAYTGAGENQDVSQADYVISSYI